MLLNFISKPDFINYIIQSMPIKTSLPTILWTIRSKEDEQKAREYGKNFVFEAIVPEEK